MTGTRTPSVSGRGMTMSDLVARHARTMGDAVAFRDGEVTLTWAQTHERITRLSSALTAHGVGAGAVDRKKDMIISGGENIYCAEVENVLAAHPKVAEVALIGVADERYGEAPLAVIAPRDPADPPTAAEIDGFCREHLASYKRPRELVIVTALPRNPSGKVLKTALRESHGTATIVPTPAV